MSHKTEPDFREQESPLKKLRNYLQEQLTSLPYDSVFENDDLENEEDNELNPGTKTFNFDSEVFFTEITTLTEFQRDDYPVITDVKDLLREYCPQIAGRLISRNSEATLDVYVGWITFLTNNGAFSDDIIEAVTMDGASLIKSFCRESEPDNARRCLLYNLNVIENFSELNEWETSLVNECIVSTAPEIALKCAQFTPDGLNREYLTEDTDDLKEYASFARCSVELYTKSLKTLLRTAPEDTVRQFAVLNYKNLIKYISHAVYPIFDPKDEILPGSEEPLDIKTASGLLIETLSAIAAVSTEERFIKNVYHTLPPMLDYLMDHDATVAVSTYKSIANLVECGSESSQRLAQICGVRFIAELLDRKYTHCAAEVFEQVKECFNITGKETVVVLDPRKKYVDAMATMFSTRFQQYMIPHSAGNKPAVRIPDFQQSFHTVGMEQEITKADQLKQEAENICQNILFLPSKTYGAYLMGFPANQ